MAMTQQELNAQTPEEELEELYEEEPRRRPWGAIVSVVLALAVIFVGYQWQQAAAREHMLRSQAHALRADAETLRLRADEAQREIEGLQKRLAAAGAERTSLVERVAALERQAQERAAAIARAAEQRGPARERARATPVVAKPRR
jgi:chromosome segregation ATPase